MTDEAQSEINEVNYQKGEVELTKELYQLGLYFN